MRVIGGIYRHRILSWPDDAKHIRPTKDRIRESIFSALGPLDGYKALDLYSGSGAMGIEALSRGCSFATFVDCNKVALDTTKGNLKSLGINNARVIAKRDTDAIASFIKNKEVFDLVGQFRVFGAAREPEVGELDLAVQAHDDVFRLDVAVAELVAGPGVGERVRDGDEDVQRLRDVQRADVVQYQFQVLPGDFLHHEIIDAIRGHARIVGLYHVRMRQAGRGARLAEEPLHVHFVAGAVVGQNLDRDLAVEVCLPCLIHDPHRAATEFLLDLETGYDFARPQVPAQRDDAAAFFAEVGHRAVVVFLRRSRFKLLAFRTEKHGVFFLLRHDRRS